MREFESFYPLSPTQQGLLFHSLLAPGSGVYVGHLVCRLHGSLSPGALREAWQSVLDRHGALRTSFRWEDLKEPVQVVHREVELPFAELDWRELGAQVQAARMEDLLHEDRARGFDLATPPLLRCLLVRLEDEAWDFVWARHHLILDGWSMALLLQEVFASYAAQVEGRRPALPLAPSYRDYIAWLRRQGREEAEARWRRVLQGMTAATPLGVDQGRGGPIDREERYGQAEARLPPETSAALQAGARRSGLTVNTLFQGAWALLLSRYSGASGVVFGTVVSGRPAAVAGIEAMVGLFINTQPLRARVPETGGLLAWLRALQTEQAGLRQDEHLSLQEIQAWSEVPRGQPLFESLLVFENFPMDASLRSGAATPPGLRIGEVRAGDRTNFPLTLTTGPSDPWTLTVSYDRSRFSSAAVSRLLGHLGVLLDALAEGLERPVETLPLLTAAERVQILEDWNRTAEAEEGPASVPAWVAEQVARTPEAVALRFEGRELTYAELDRRARALAVQLRRLGVGPGTRVAVALERSEAMVVALLGTMRAGAAYVPLDPAYPRERLDYMRSDSGARVLLGEGGLAPAEWDSEAPDEALPDLPAGLPCYLIYTSGSTGRPKAVEIPHGAVVNFLQALQSRLGLAAGETLVAVTSLSFDIAGLELFLPLGVGATIELASREVAADGVRLRRLIEQSGATALQATPSTWRLLRAAGFAAKPPFRQLCGGEALPRELADSLLAGGAGLWNLYGPTETTIWSAMERVEAGPGPVSLGKPIRNTTLYVLDRALRPVPVGVEGELHIGGAGLALGYAGQPGQTAERFGPDPFGTVGGRLYRTGDLVRWLEDGRLEYRGRLDHQVKLRGHRIELGEVEAGLERHPEVAQAVAAVREGPGGEPRLVAWVVPAPGATLSPESLRRLLEQELPEVMIPTAWVFLPELPLTPNGKVDRKALPEPEGRAESAIYEAPESEAERRVAEAWQQVLGLDRAGRHDNFFDLGGSSMLAIQVHHKLQRSLGVEVSLVDLFEHPTIARLAAALQARIEGAERAVEPAEIVSRSDENAVAVIGMACRVPGAWSVEEYWQNLLGGVESITFFSREELLASGLTEEMVDDPRRIAARGCLAGIEDFDASFFGVTPREAELLDPQHRIFLECAWEALERAGYGGDDTNGRVGVFAGASLNGYLLANIAPQIERLGRDGSWEILLGNDKDYLTTRASYLLGLTGPSMLVQTACSTSLVAIHMARESMLRGECELALAGGISGRVPQAVAHVYQEGGITSPDGHCRAFDASARGTVGGNGIGVVVLKKLSAALRDGDRIVAVLKGSAINNDGGRKVGFTAPSVEGQASVIRATLVAAGVDGASVGYVEAHGT
ncbi:MAG TPA: amino acid adenylation domain-containing protein, partial [Thermoanaerobaculia bacterium]|nr:amino acid adenylation domain-containing protein [Thermoanaerobaculia bacterium]